MNTNKLSIESRRLLLVPVNLKYKENIFKEFTPEIVKYMFPESPIVNQETIDYIESATQLNKDGHDFAVAILDKLTKEYLGSGGIHKINTKTPELGIWIKKSAHAKAYGKEAVTALKEWADANCDFDYIIYPVVAVNYASRRIPESLGGVIFCHFELKNAAGEAFDGVEYRIYPKE